MSGGFNAYEHDSAAPQRLDEIQSAVREIDADIIGLVDTFRWDEIFSSQQLRDLFGYDHVFTIKLNDERLQELGHDNGLTLMSKVPWLNCEAINLGTRNALKSSFDINGREITVCLAYLDDLNEDVRLDQTKAIVDACGTKDVLIIGDLNTLVPDEAQDISPELEVFYASNPGIEQKLSPVVGQMQRGEVISWLKSQGFTDAGAGAGPTMPSKLFPAVVDGPFLRIDYCQASPQININNFAVHTTEVMQKASDHLPISFNVE